VGKDTSINTAKITPITQDPKEFPSLTYKPALEPRIKKYILSQDNNKEKLMSSFLINMKLLINPLIQLLTTVKTN